MKKRVLAIVLTGVLALASLTGCGKETGKEEKVIKIAASATPHAEILEQAKPILEKQGIKLSTARHRRPAAQICA